MGKGEKSSIGRALVKHHNQLVSQVKDKSYHYRNQQKVLQSITEVSDIDAAIEQADQSDRLLSFDPPASDVLINLDASSTSSSMSPEEMREQQRKEEALHACSLRIPRRPPWNSKMTLEEFDSNEKQAFLVWRRSLAKLEENEKLVLTPFEKNLDIWRQLWRVVERSDLLVMVVDARDPLFYRCIDLEVYARETDEPKKVILLINKADLLPYAVREIWAKYFQTQSIPFLFWSAKAVLEGRVPTPGDNDTKIHGRDELLSRLQSEAGKPANSDDVVVGFVGYPNVGKSSTINALIGQKRTGVTSTPGKTKHFQTLQITESLTLCDCPGLVFPSFSSSRYEMIASGVLPIDRMTGHREAVQVVADKVPRKTLEAIYGITLPKPRPYESQSRPPHASELLRSFCASRGFVASSARPDETRAARLILKDYVEGKLPHYELPPATTGECDFVGPDGEECGVGVAALDDLNSFDVAHGISSMRVVAEKKQTEASHKQHKKPPRKKDRSWRARDDDGCAQPVPRVFHRAVNTGPLKGSASIY